ncbi:Hyaluronan synthase [uncultured Roseburia sp.]|uniref:Glycosyltransferase n=1 Tax=Brotonthovivens ammoniilytica TaxID=2981725 RepID=A0ABT2TN84_9FIRM|nr:glycosyltransferase family 2 protein [Brotonthovivens ammoniilytica]MCU6763689.1 glycosyltransferase [Brotonthovivens ammoniilytica]SCJ30698.1 Hyaluronan synthase [uncultured Roseburia sp.]
MKTAISVILPIYNQETYLRQCLDSIIEQTLKDIEILCVNDGSTDSTAEILSEYQRKDSRIKVFTQEQKGAGAARNLGLSQASGEFLVFWDSDDWFEKDALETMYMEIIKKHGDICVCGVRKYNEADGSSQPALSYLKLQYLEHKTVFNIKDIPSRIFNFTTNVPWNKMFRRSFILDQNIRWQEIPRSNDTLFVMTALSCADKICYTSKFLIHYRVNNPKSLMGSVSAQPLCVCEAYQETYRQLISRQVLSDPSVTRSFCNKALDTLLYVLASQTDAAAFIKLYGCIKDQLIPLLGITAMQEQDFYNKEQYHQLQLILQHTPSEYLLLNWKDGKAKVDQLKRETREVAISKFKAAKFILKQLKIIKS